MRSKLTLSVTLMPDEFTTDYCARLALRNFRSASAFALDMGFTFPDLAGGSPIAIAKLSEVSGEPLALLEENSLRWMKTDRCRMKGQVLARQTFRHGHFVGCPECFKEDIETSALPAVAAVRHRMHWVIASVQTCEKHHIALQKLGDTFDGNVRRNWSDIADSIVRNLPVLAATAVPRSPSNFEIYLINRLYDAPTQSWLDRLEFFAAEHSARIFGVVANPNLKTPIYDLSDLELRGVGQAGFEAVNGGAESISLFLLDLQRNIKRGKAKLRAARGVTPAMAYGRMYASLKRLEKNPAFLPVRQIVAEHALANFPLGPGDTVLGVALESRRLHSVATVAKHFRISPPRALNILTAGGFLPQPGWNDHEAAVDSLEAERLIGQQMESITQLQAQRHLNVSENVMDSLIECNLISRHKQSAAVHAHRFLISELDDFLAGLISGAAPVAPGTSGVFSLSDVAQKVKTSVHAIVTLIVNRRLKWVGYRTDLRGFSSLVVKPKDVADVLRKSDPQKLSTAATASRLNLSQHAVRHLLRQKLLVATQMKHPVTNQMRDFFEQSDIDRFDAEYVSLFNLSRLTGTQGAKLRKEFAQRSIFPVVEKIGVTTIYRRVDLGL
jgi:hypothetical protein